MIVRSAPEVNAEPGTPIRYGAVIEYTEDKVLSLKPIQAVIYGDQLLAACAQAEAQFALWKQLGRMDMSDEARIEMVRLVVRRLRDKRGVEGVQFSPMLVPDKEPLVRMDITIGGPTVSFQLTVPEGHDHAVAVLSAPTYADFDTCLFEAGKIVGIDDYQAQAMVADLGNYIPGNLSPDEDTSPYLVVREDPQPGTTSQG